MEITIVNIMHHIKRVVEFDHKVPETSYDMAMEYMGRYCKDSTYTLDEYLKEKLHGTKNK